MPKIETLNKILDVIGEKLDSRPTNLDRGKYVDGAISFESLILDLITGGGLPPGKITDVFGLEGSAKSTLCYHIIANAIKNEVLTLFFDHEAATDPIYSRNLGIRTSDPKHKSKQNPYFRYYQPDNGEETYKTMNRILKELPDFEGVRDKPVMLFVVDSLASMTPESMVEDDEKSLPAVAAKMHSEWIRRVKSRLGKKNVSWLFTNQIRQKPMAFGNPEYEPGGEAPRFYPDLKIRMQAVGKPWNERGRDLRFINISTIKNKQFPPFRTVKEKLAVSFGRGFERGFDGIGFLELTGQVDIGKGKIYHVKMEGDKKFNGKYSAEKMMVLMHSNDWRRFARKQMHAGVAFKLYFDNQGIDPDATLDPEDAGIDFGRKHTKKLKEEKKNKKDAESDE